MPWNKSSQHNSHGPRLLESGIDAQLAHGRSRHGALRLEEFELGTNASVPSSILTVMKSSRRNIAK